MFEALGRAVVRGRWFVIAGWLLVAAGMVLFVPSLAQVGTASDVAFLPRDAPSLVAQDVIEREFPGLATAGQGLIVANNPVGLQPSDRDYMRALVAWLGSKNAPPPVGTVTSAFGQPELEELLVSKDGTTMLVRLDFTTPTYSDATNKALADIRDHIGVTHPAGLVVDFTGQAAIAKDLLGTILDSVSQTTLVTIVLVILVLLLIYHAPVAAGIPLVTIGVAFLITRGLLGLLVQSGVMRVSSMVEAFIVVLIFGAGTDYALFLISRYREEVARRADHDRQVAGIQTVAKIGPVITASAATVIIGTFGMIIARFEMTRTQGPAMAMGIAVGLLASLTLTPALLSVLGKYLFWPFQSQIRKVESEAPRASGFWQRLATVITTRPAVVAVGITALLLLPYLALPKLTRSFDILNELPREAESRHGFDTLRQHFDQGEMLPVSVVITGTSSLETPAGLARIAGLQAALARVPGVGKVRSVVNPSAGADPDLDRNLLARQQVVTLTAQLKNSLAGVDATSLAAGNTDPVSGLDQMQTYLNDLGAAFPEVARSDAYAEARSSLEGLKSQITEAVQGLQVSTQLGAMAAQVGRVVTSTATTGGEAGQAAGPAQSLKSVQGYLVELASAYPEVKTDPAYGKAVASLGDLGKALTAAAEQRQVSAQLGALANQVGQIASSTATAQATPGAAQTRPEDRIKVVGAYLQELAGAYPEVRANAAYGDALAVAGQMQQLLGQLSPAEAQSTGGTPSAAQARQVQQARAQIPALAGRLEADLRALAQAFAGRDAPFSSGVLSLTPQAAQMREAVKQSAAGAQASLSTLAKRFEGRDARLLPKSVPQSAEKEAKQAEMKQAAGDLTTALDRLAGAAPGDAYFIPATLIKAEPKLGSLVNTYLSSSRTSSQMHVLLALDPYSEAALDTINEIDSTANAEAARLGMSAYVAGPTAQVRDIHEMVDDDLPRVMALVVGGVLLVFVLLLGSLVAPIYLVATVLLSYGTTMGLITILFQWLLGQSGVNYVIPTIILVLLVALGADYNIFLVSRVWEEAGKEGSAREGVRRASAYTGGVITSAGIILAGTFAALTVSPIQTLSQVGTAVALGVLVDTFIVRAVLVPAIAALVGRLNWWPAKRPAGHGGAFQVIADMLRPSAPRGPRGAHR